MSERTLCGAIKNNGRDCEGPVPPDAPVNLCLDHLAKAYLYVRDLFETADDRLVGDLAAPSDKPRKLERDDGSVTYYNCVVYYARFGDRIKIGTTKDLWSRMGKIPHDRVLATEPGSYDLENQRHKEFKAFQLRGEWFRDCPEIRRHVNALRRQYGDPLQKRWTPISPAAVLENAPWER